MKDISTLALIELATTALNEIDRRDQADNLGPTGDDKGVIDIVHGRIERTDKGWVMTWNAEVGVDAARHEYGYRPEPVNEPRDEVGSRSF